MDRLASEVFGEFVADGDIADRLTLTDPQRFQGSGPGGPPRQLHVGEGVEQLLRTRAVQPLDCCVDGIRTARMPARRSTDPLTTVPSAFNDHSASRTPYGRLCTWKVQPPPSSSGCKVSCTSREALLGQDDRLVEEDVLHPRRRADRGQGHRRVRRAGNDDGAVDDVIGQPRLRLDGQPAGVDGVAGGEILCTAQDSGYRGARLEPAIPEVLGQKRRRWNG